MDLLVTVGAGSIGDLLGIDVWIVGTRGVPGLDVALLAESRNPLPQQSRVGGAVRVMAVGAAFDDRRMLPEIRSPLLGMARVTVLVDRIFAQHRRRDAAMRVVAVAARHLVLAEWHVRAAHELRPSRQMALRADLDLGRLRQVVSVGHRGHNLVAGHASNPRTSWVLPVK